MFINKSKDGLNNLCGKNIAHFRTELCLSQRELVDKNAIQRIECGKRFVTDIELVAFARQFEKSIEELIL